MIADVMLPLPVSLASLLVPFHLACQAIVTCWYATAGYDPADVARPRTDGKNKYQDIRIGKASELMSSTTIVLPHAGQFNYYVDCTE